MCSHRRMRNQVTTCIGAYLFQMGIVVSKVRLRVYDGFVTIGAAIVDLGPYYFLAWLHLLEWNHGMDSEHGGGCAYWFGVVVRGSFMVSARNSWLFHADAGWCRTFCVAGFGLDVWVLPFGFQFV